VIETWIFSWVSVPVESAEELLSCELKMSSWSRFGEGVQLVGVVARVLSRQGISRGWAAPWNPVALATAEVRVGELKMESLSETKCCWI